MADLSKFNLVTVLDVKVEYGEGSSFLMDSLRISNITQEGPIKEARGGLENRPLIRHGKTVRLEMEDVLMRKEALEAFMGANVDEATSAISITEKFPNKGLTLTGYTYMIGDAGEREYIKMTFHDFWPDGIFDLSMESEGDVAVLSIQGELFANCDGEFFSIESFDGEVKCSPAEGEEKYTDPVTTP